MLFFGYLRGVHLLMPDSQAANHPFGSRVYWGHYTHNQKFDLTRLQKESYQWFIDQGIGEILQSMNPVLDFTSKNWKLEFGNYSFGSPRYNPDEAIYRGVSFESPLRVDVMLTNLQDGTTYQQEVFLGDIP
jgi:DNA-directed RNA polymerase subunit beta